MDRRTPGLDQSAFRSFKGSAGRDCANMANALPVANLGAETLAAAFGSTRLPP